MTNTENAFQNLFDIEAEKAVLGALILNWDAMSSVVSTLKSDKFYSKQNQVIYECMTELFEKNTRFDIITLITTLEKNGTLGSAGGKVYISSLTSSIPTTANLDFYVAIILDKATRRDIVKTSIDITKSAYDLSHTGKAVLEEAEQSIFSIAKESVQSKVYKVDKVVSDIIDHAKLNIGSMGSLIGVPSGIIKLDFMTNGFQNSDLVIIGARPSIGKTAFALSMIEHIAIKKRIECAFFSVEMSATNIGQRLLSQMTHIPCGRIRSVVSQNELITLQDAQAQYKDAPLYIVDTPNIKLLELHSVARNLKAQHDIKIIFIDYIGLIRTEQKNAPVYEVVSEITKSLKALARELEIPIVALCQVARDAEGKEPNLAQLRGSGSVEQDADIVMFLHRERQEDCGTEDAQDAKLIVAKQRNGATGVVNMHFFPKWTKFENIAYN